MNLNARFNGEFRTRAGRGTIAANELVDSNFVVDFSGKYHFNKNLTATANIINYINKREIVVFKDKFMDFFGVRDAFKVIDLYLKSGSNLPKELNLVYPETVLLSEVADMINNLSDHEVPVDVLESGYDRSYCGSGGELSKLGLELDGLQKSLQYVYENIRQRNV